MFELQLKHGESIMDRMARQADIGNGRVPAHLAAFENELRPWYDSVANVIKTHRLGRAEDLAARWRRGYDDAMEVKQSWLRTHHEDIVGSYVAYMRSMLSALTALNNEVESRKLLIPDRVTLPWLWANVPLTLWSAAFSILVAVFVLGTQSIRLNVVREALSLPLCKPAQGTATPGVK